MIASFSGDKAAGSREFDQGHRRLCFTEIFAAVLGDYEIQIKAVSEGVDV